MQIPKYYCPTCDEYKRWYQIHCFWEDNIGFWIECKKCKTSVIPTKELLEKAIERIKK